MEHRIAHAALMLGFAQFSYLSLERCGALAPRNYSLAQLLRTGTITETIAALRKDAPVQMVPCLFKRLLLLIFYYPIGP